MKTFQRYLLLLTILIKIVSGRDYVLEKIPFDETVSIDMERVGPPDYWYFHVDTNDQLLIMTVKSLLIPGDENPTSEAMCRNYYTNRVTVIDEPQVQNPEIDACFAGNYEVSCGKQRPDEDWICEPYSLAVQPLYRFRSGTKFKWVRVNITNGERLRLIFAPYSLEASSQNYPCDDRTTHIYRGLVCDGTPNCADYSRGESADENKNCEELQTTTTTPLYNSTTLTTEAAESAKNKELYSRLLTIAGVAAVIFGFCYYILVRTKYDRSKYWDAFIVFLNLSFFTFFANYDNNQNEVGNYYNEFCIGVAIGASLNIAAVIYYRAELEKLERRRNDSEESGSSEASTVQSRRPSLSSIDSESPQNNSNNFGRSNLSASLADFIYEESVLPSASTMPSAPSLDADTSYFESKDLPPTYDEALRI